MIKTHVAPDGSKYYEVDGQMFMDRDDAIRAEALLNNTKLATGVTLPTGHIMTINGPSGITSINGQYSSTSINSTYFDQVAKLRDDLNKAEKEILYARDEANELISQNSKIERELVVTEERMRGLEAQVEVWQDEADRREDEAREYARILDDVVAWYRALPTPINKEDFNNIEKLRKILSRWEDLG